MNSSKIFCFDIKIFVKIPNRDYHKVCKSVVIVSSDRTVPIKLLNPGNKSIVIPKGQILAQTILDTRSSDESNRPTFPTKLQVFVFTI
jgi:hypothetical protein